MWHRRMHSGAYCAHHRRRASRNHKGGPGPRLRTWTHRDCGMGHTATAKLKSSSQRACGSYVDSQICCPGKNFENFPGEIFARVLSIIFSKISQGNYSQSFFGLCFRTFPRGIFRKAFSDYCFERFPGEFFAKLFRIVRSNLSLRKNSFLFVFCFCVSSVTCRNL